MLDAVLNCSEDEEDTPAAAPPYQPSVSYTSPAVRMAKDALIVQFSTAGDTSDFDALISFEESLLAGLERNHSGVVDGHDFGQGTINIFVFPKSGRVEACTDVIKAYMKHHKLSSRGIIVRRTKSENYSIVWPEDHDGEYERC